MALPNPLRDYDLMLTTVSVATISTGFTVAVVAPSRAEITGVLLGPVDGATTITGSATLTFTVAGVAGATVACAASGGGGLSTGTTEGSGVTLSARQFCNQGDMIKMVLGAGLTCAQNATVTVILRTRSA